MALGVFRGDRWALLGLVIFLAVLILARRLVGITDDLSLRLMLIMAVLAMLVGAMVLMYFRGPDGND
jgi:fatty acid desaturase